MPFLCPDSLAQQTFVLGANVELIPHLGAQANQAAPMQQQLPQVFVGRGRQPCLWEALLQQQLQ
jgi:hypothetical protein